MAARGRAGERRLPLGALLLAGLAWAALILWREGPHGRFLDHGGWLERGLPGAICTAIPGGPALLPAALYLASWLLMAAAMMLPTSLPLIRLFQRVVAARADAGRLMALLIAGYLLAWSAFGLVAHAADAGLHRAAAAMPLFAVRAWLIGPAILAIAGLFQFSRLKYLCLDKCRTPLSFVAGHWGGRRPGRDAFRLGLDHGLFCVGCCWALMMLMFVVGTGSLLWMLGLAGVMAIEKNARWGRHIPAPLGAALLGAAALIVIMRA